ncbi:hypothetical protein HU200_002784 [Digitaria exilis]|uniref:Uncharacterized protein n=1 Tax=Digitaria exilis TaxID=1010633 RepID=A0A835KTI0_9POAL|nr:hypothetical protein HU200_002784 [Digitaria exilis]
MQAFLRADDGARENTGVLKAYLELIRDMAYDIEDCLEEYMVFIKNKNFVKQLLRLGARHRIALQIRTLKQRVQNLSNGPRVVSLVGMGGIGKTALARKVYDSKDLSDMFSTRAWITVSQSFDQKELFKEMIMQLFGAESWDKFLKDHQGQVTEITFQDSGKDDSCVVVTTRNGKLAEYCSPPSHIHRPEFLGEEEATTLFLKKTNKSLEVLEKDENTKGIVEKILKKCGGLPLAILTIGGLLANKVTEEWESIYKQLPWDLATNPSLDALRQVEIEHWHGFKPGAGSYVYALPRSIENLQGLEIFDIRCSAVSTLPTEITKLQKLRSLRCSKVQGYDYFGERQYSNWFSDSLALINLGDKRYRNKEATADLHMALSSCWSHSSGVKLPRGVGRLKQLHILEKVDIKRTSRKAIKELGKLTQLRKLVVRGRGASKENCKEFRDAAQKLSCLLSLNVGTKEWMKEAEPLDILVSFTSALLSLEKLKLKGLLKKIPAWVGKSVNLVKVDLKHCRLKELDALAGLPNLIRLRLYEYAYDAEKLVYCKDAFPKLRVLLLKAQHDVALREVTFEWSTSPNMETIRIENCRLASGINGMKHLPKFNKISILGSASANSGPHDAFKSNAGNPSKTWISTRDHIPRN